MTHISPMYNRYCKRGHLRTEETTFPRKVKKGGKLYIVRECRACHSIRNTPPPKIAPNKNTKWKRIAEGAA
jgi:cytochrome c5